MTLNYCTGQPDIEPAQQPLTNKSLSPEYDRGFSDGWDKGHAHRITERNDMSKEAMQMALEALEQLQGGCTDHDDGTVEAITVWCPEVIDALREALAQPAQQEPVAAEQRYRHPQKTMPDWSPWLPCKLANRPAWEIDSRGYEVEYRALYAHPAPAPAQQAEALRIAGLTLIGLAEHDPHCEVLDLDDEGKHRACTCGLTSAITTITQDGKSVHPAPAQQHIEMMCKHCGDRTMHSGNVCYSCTQARAQK